MTRYERLKQEARDSAIHRGHDMTNFRDTGTGIDAFAHCRRCDATAVVHAEPFVNEIEIHGVALAVNCGIKGGNHAA